MAVLFHITCVTCRAKLEVRNARAIGQILSCPRCGSLVEVQPPSTWHDPEADQDTVEDLPPPSVTGSETPAMPGDDWISPGTRRLRRIGLLAGGVILLLAIAVVGWQVWFGSPSQPAGSIVAGAEDADEPGQPNSASTGDRGKTPDKLDKPDKQAEAAPPDAGGKPDAEKKPTRPAPERVAKDESKQKETPQQKQDANGPQTDRSKAEGGAADGPGEANGAPGADASGDGEAAPPGMTPRTVDQTEKAAGALKRLEAMIHPQDASADEEPQAGAGRKPAEADATDPAPVARPRLRDVAGALHMPIPRLELDNLPLDRLPRLVFGLTNVPLVLDDDALHARSVSLDSPLTGEWRDVTLQTVLHDIAQQKQLALITGPHALHLSLPPAESIRADLAAADFPGGGLDAAAFRSMLTQLLGMAQSSSAQLKAVRQGDRWKIDATLETIHAVRTIQARFLWNRWEQRIGKGVPKGGDGPRKGTWEGPLGKPVRLSLFHPTPLADVLDDLRATTGLRIVADWASLAPCGCAPDSQVALVMTDRPLAEVLHGLLSRSRATFRLIDDRTIEIRGAMLPLQGSYVAFHRVSLEAEDMKAEIDRRLRKEFGDRLPTWYWEPGIACVMLRATSRAHARVERALRSEDRP